MTTCAQCLAELSTMRAADFRQDSSTAAHLDSCPRCASIAEEIAYAERRLSTALAETYSSFSPEELSQAALTGSERERRRHVGSWVRGLLTVAGCVVLYVFAANVFIPLANRSEKIRTETITLHCLTPEQAMDIATPYLRSGVIYRTKGLPIVTLRARHEEFVLAYSHIQSIDAQCGLPNSGRIDASGVGRATSPVHVDPSLTTPEPSATSSDKPKKD